MTSSGTLGVVRALVCEDEPLAARAIREYLQDIDWIEIVGEARNGREALRLINKLDPDLLFLDVRMPGMNGIDVLRAVEAPPAVVFTTAFDEYALPAFDVGAVDYLLKPFGRERLLQTLDRVRIRLVGEAKSSAADTGVAASAGLRKGRFAERLFARHKQATVPVPVGEIRRIEASGGGASLVTPAGTFELDETLGELEERLDPADFVRIHRAHLVNLAHVVSIHRYDERRQLVRLDDGTKLVSSRRGAQKLREMGA